MRFCSLAGLALILLFLVGFPVVTGSLWPDYPERWRDPRVGMTREELDAGFPAWVSGLHELKGRDLLQSEVPFLGESGIWYLDLEIGDDGGIESGRLTFRNDVSGVFNVDRMFPLRK
jgi:hypothetical protein